MDRLIDFLELVRGPDLDIRLSVYSLGPGFDALRGEFSGLEWVEFFERIGRREFGELLAEFDVGAVVTDDRVSLPAFPSKLTNYAQYGLASFCLVESGSELFKVTEGVRCVHLNPFDFSRPAVNRAKAFFAYAVTDEARAEALQMAEQFTVELASQEIMR